MNSEQTHFAPDLAAAEWELAKLAEVTFVAAALRAGTAVMHGAEHVIGAKPE